MLAYSTIVVLECAGAAPHTTTLGQFLADNRDSLDLGEATDIRAALSRRWYYRGGGGAEPEWSLRLPWLTQEQYQCREWYEIGARHGGFPQGYYGAALDGPHARLAYLAGVMARAFGVDLRECLP